jgi:protein-tyrosine phosphatase
MFTAYIRTRYGGISPYINLLCSKIVYLLGGYNSERDIDWQRVERLVYVCKGNINRSPFAAYYSKPLIKNVYSVGLDTQNGLSASEEALRNAARRGIGLQEHKTCRISDFEFEEGDLLVAFEPNQAVLLREMSLTSGSQITLVGIWGKKVYPFIQDPICREDGYFQFCYGRIEDGIDGLVAHISSTA